MLDGVYRCGADGAPTFIEAAASTDEELHALLQTSIARFMKVSSHARRAAQGDGADLAGRAGYRRLGGAHGAAAEGGWPIAAV